MPELPEVETIRTQMEKEIVGKTIAGVWVGKEKMWQGDKGLVIAKKILAVKRRAKMLIWELSGETTLLFHLKMSGQLVLKKSKISHRAGSRFAGKNPRPVSAEGGQKPKTQIKNQKLSEQKDFPKLLEVPDKYTRIIITFADGEKVYFNDLRMFGWVRVGGNVGELREVKGLEKLGPEPFDKEFTDEYLKRIFSKTSRSIKQVLIDQEKIAGIGNIYCCEALFLAGISPTKEARALGNKDIAILRDSIIKVLREGLKYGGSSGADEQYVDLYGQKGEMQEHFNVYQRQGKKCPQCGETIRRINLGGRGTFYCPACQR